VKQRNQRQILDAQTGFRAREEEVRPSLVKLAQEDPDPRVRACTISLLGGFKAPPPERFFIERLGDGQEYPRESALAALERLGTAACLDAVDRLAAADPVDRLRSAAARTRKAVRARLHHVWRNVK
jgi:HEAT repeat protein